MNNYWQICTLEYGDITMSLFCKFKEIKEHYYTAMSNDNCCGGKDDTYINNQMDLFENGKFSHPRAYCLLISIFKHGRKESAFELSFVEDYKNHGKHLHTVALYFLGRHLENIVTSNLLQKLISCVILCFCSGHLTQLKNCS
jgi:hypothetical protein